jgi:hypothetical protein
VTEVPATSKTSVPAPHSQLPFTRTAATTSQLSSVTARHGLSGCGDQTVSVSDHYADGTYRWWHLPVPSAELLGAITDGWLPASGYALEVGCGHGTEGAYLSGIGWSVVGVDLWPVALAAPPGSIQNPSTCART